MSIGQSLDDEQVLLAMKLLAYQQDKELFSLHGETV